MALTVFVIAIHPAKGVKEPEIVAWLIGGGIVLVISAVLTAMGLNHGPAAKATLVGLAAGALFGLHGAITKGTVEEFGNGFLGPFETWPLYALIVIGLVSMTISQISLQAGDLPPAIADAVDRGAAGRRRARDHCLRGAAAREGERRRSRSSPWWRWWSGSGCSRPAARAGAD